MDGEKFAVAFSYVVGTREAALSRSRRWVWALKARICCWVFMFEVELYQGCNRFERVVTSDVSKNRKAYRCSKCNLLDQSLMFCKRCINDKLLFNADGESVCR